MSSKWISIQNILASEEEKQQKRVIETKSESVDRKSDSDLILDYVALDQKNPSTSILLESSTQQNPGSNRTQHPTEPGFYQKLDSNRIEELGYLQLVNSILDTLPKLLSPYEMMVYLRLYRLSYGFHKSTCIVGNKGLTSHTGMSESQVRRALTKLIFIGLIKIVKIHNTGDKTGQIGGTEYEVLAPITQNPGSDRTKY